MGLGNPSTIEVTRKVNKRLDESKIGTCRIYSRLRRSVRLITRMELLKWKRDPRTRGVKDRTFDKL